MYGVADGSHTSRRQTEMASLGTWGNTNYGQLGITHMQHQYSGIARQESLAWTPDWVATFYIRANGVLLTMAPP